MEVRHVVFNPTMVVIGESPLSRLCEREEKDGWKLDKVVPFHMYESIAIFVRDEVPPSSVDAGDRLVDAAFEVMDKTLNTTWVIELANNAIKAWEAAQRGKKNA